MSGVSVRSRSVATTATMLLLALPGAAGEDWVPWFTPLAAAPWRGRLSIEANGNGADDATVIVCVCPAVTGWL